ncbi:hypothetical protein diail_868 [Diaporthe ilicicola]|nr:hypothetical protein diail_868 [Diaporthe ilicicola]
MFKSFVQALCLLAAARCAGARPRDNSQWPFSELLYESPFEHHEKASSELAAAKVLAPCATETLKGLGPTVSPDTAAAFSADDTFKNTASTYGVSNSSFLISVVNHNGSFEYGGNTFLGWMNQATYSPYNCQLACNALNATGTKCNTYNTYFLRSPQVTPSMDSSCPNPASMTTIVCAMWKNKLYPWDGINTGETRGLNFTVVIAGSNMYQRNNSESL